ncbi:MAG TPA: ABC transporter permease, partial [Solirubrobacteraceae bacterium]|nr:ABC transporter permease [Solirubrobacteraceae bacterium]
MTDAALTGPPPPPAASPARPDTARLPVRELFGTALQGLRTRRLRAALSALGIAIGIGAMVAVVGVSASSQAQLLAEIDALGTNLLTATPGQTLTGNNEIFPTSSVPMVAGMPHVNSDVATYQVSGAVVLRSPYVPAQQTGGIGVEAAGPNLPQVVGAGMAAGHFLDAVSARYPEVVLGAQAASILQIESVGGHVEVYLGSTWFNVVGILKPVLLDSTLDTTVFMSLPVAERLFRIAPNPSEIYVRADVNSVTSVANLLASTTDPQNASGVDVSRPSNALEARAAAKGQFTTLLLGLGAVALLVGAIGIANIMVISVLERRGEIGLRRALGATRRHISLQFLTESALLAALGAVVGL